MSSQVLIHPKPYQFESLANYMVRIKNENYLEMDWINERLRLSKSKYLRQFNLIEKEETLVDICKLTGIDKERLQDMVLNKYFYLSAFKNTKVNETFLHAYIIESEFSKYCPLCLKENPYHKIYWQLKKIRICLEHKIMLIKSCSMCGNNIRIKDIVNGSCACGQLLVNGEYRNCNNEKIIKNQKRVYKIYGEYLKKPNKVEKTIILDDLQDREQELLMNLLENLIKNNLDFLMKYKPVYNVDKNNNLIWIEYIEEIIESWPKGLFRILDIMNQNYCDLVKFRKDDAVDEYMKCFKDNELYTPLFVLRFTYPYNILRYGLDKSNYLNYELMKYIISTYNIDFFVKRMKEMSAVKEEQNYKGFCRMIEFIFGMDYDAITSIITLNNNLKLGFNEKVMFSILEQIVNLFVGLIKAAKKSDIKITANSDYISLIEIYKLFKELYISFKDIINIIKEEKVELVVYPLKNGAHMVYFPKELMKKKLLLLAASRI